MAGLRHEPGVLDPDQSKHTSVRAEDKLMLVLCRAFPTWGIVEVVAAMFCLSLSTSRF